MNDENEVPHEADGDMRAKFMPMMDEGFREIARAMQWTEVTVNGPTPHSDTFTVALLGACATRDNNFKRVHIVTSVARDEKTAIARMREQALDIAIASVGMLRETINASREEIRVMSLGLDAINREVR